MARHWDAHPHVRTGNELTFRERAADVLKHYFGTWSALGIVGLIIAVWMVLQAVVPSIRWDPYPYILLNLCLSCLAAVQGIILQISANRGDKIASEVAMSTHETTQQILQINNSQSEILDRLDGVRDDVSRLTEQLEEVIAHG